MYIFFLWSLILTYLNLYNDALIEIPDWSMLSTYLPKHIHKLGPCPWICGLHLSEIELYITAIWGCLYTSQFVVLLRQRIYIILSNLTISLDWLPYKQNKRIFSYNLPNCEFFAFFNIFIYFLVESVFAKEWLWHHLEFGFATKAF